MKYFFDTEFEDHEGWPTTLISIGVVDEMGNTYYAENKDWNPVTSTKWLRENVAPHLVGGTAAKSIAQIVEDLKRMTYHDPEVQFWAYYGAYDWVFMCAMFGGFFRLPPNWRKVVFELDQWMATWGIPRDRWPKQQSGEHHALNDALWNQEVYQWARTQFHEA